jgi:hypothetical protein
MDASVEIIATQNDVIEPALDSRRPAVPPPLLFSYTSSGYNQPFKKK